MATLQRKKNTPKKVNENVQGIVNSSQPNNMETVREVNTAQSSFKPNKKNVTRLNNDEITIRRYESIPSYNAVERMFDNSKAKAYEEKQSLVDEYSAAKSRQAQKLMEQKGISQSDLERAYYDKYSSQNGFSFLNGNDPVSYLVDRYITNSDKTNAAKEAIESKGLTEKESDLLKYYRDRLSLEQKVQDAAEFADEHEVLGTLGANGSRKLAGSLTSTLGNLGAYLTGNPIESDNNWNLTGNTVDAMRESASQDLGKVGKFAYNVGTSINDMGPAMVSMIATGGSTAAPMLASGVTAFGDSTREGAERGLTPNQIMATGATSAAVEAAFEKIPLEGLTDIFSKPGKEAAQSLVREIAGQMGREAFEEAGTEAVNAFADAVINGDKSNFELSRQAYMSMGMSAEDATKQSIIDIGKNAAYSGLAGAVSGGVMGGGASLSTRLGGNNMQTSNASSELSQLDPLNALGLQETTAEQITSPVETVENTQTANTLPVENQTENETVNANGIDVGKVTHIKNPYIGEKPIQSISNNGRVDIPQENYDNAISNIEKARVEGNASGKSIKTLLTKMYESIFPPNSTSKNIVVNGVKFGNADYTVTVNKNVVGKIMSDHHMSAEKISVLDNLDEIVSRADYVGSGNYVAHGEKGKTNVIRYDYFETPATINNTPYIVTFDVEVYPGKNNYRTHKVINEINLTPSGETGPLPAADTQLSTDTGPVPAVSVDSSSLSNNSIPNSAENVNATAESTQNIVGFDELNKALDRLVGMYKGNENTQSLYAQMKSAVNEYVQTGNQTAIDRAVTLAADIDSSLVGHSYTRKGSGKSSAKSQNNRVTTTFSEGEFVDTLLSYGNSLRDAARSNRNKTVMPNSTERISQTRTNTFNNSGMFTEEEGNTYHPLTDFTYESISEQESMNAAQENLSRRGETYVNELLSKSERLSGSEIDALMLEYSRLSKEARENNDSAIWNKASDVLKRVQTQSSLNAQALQALAKWSRNTPEGQLAEAMQEISDANKKTYGKKRVEKAEETADAVYNALTYNKAKLDSVLSNVGAKDAKQLSLDLQSGANANRNTVIDILKKHGVIDTKVADAIKTDTATQRKVLDILDQVYNMDMNSKEAKTLMARAGKLLSQNMTHTLPEKVKQVLYNQMLGNFRTLISRNALGNLGVSLAEQARQPLAATIDRMVATKTGNRTTTGWSLEKQGAYLKGAIKGISEEMSDIALSFKEYKNGSGTGLHTSKNGENTLVNAIKNNDSAFAGKNVFSKLLNIKNDLVQHGLSFGDRPFYEAAKAQAEVEIRTLVNKQMSVDTQGLNLDEFIDLSSSLIALESVYQGDTKLSQGFNEIRNGLAKMCEGLVGADIITQFSVPFVKTPSNVLDMAIEYSPFGVIKNTINTVTEVRKGDFQQRRFVDETSRNIIGTALLAACVTAFGKGLISGGYDEDKDMKNAQKAAGMQEYALHVGNKYIDLGWVPVLGAALEAGASAGDEYNKSIEEGKSNTQAIASGGLAAMGQTAQSVFDQSMLSSLSDLLGNSYSDDENFLGKVASNAASQLIGQGTSSLGRQVAQSLDPYERELGKYGTTEYYVNNFINNIPFLRESLPIKYDTEGNIVLNNQGRDTGSRLFENMLFPGKITEEKDSAVYNEGMNLYNSTGEKSVFPKTAEWSYKINGKKVELNNEQHAEFQRIMGENAYAMASAFMASDNYNVISDEQKTGAISAMFNFADALAKSELLGYDVENSDTYRKKYSVYQEKGAEGVAYYCAFSEQIDEDNDIDAYDVVDTSNLSTEDKGYYLRMFDSPSSDEEKAKLDEIKSDYGYEGLYNWYSIKDRKTADNNTNAAKVSAVDSMDISDEEKGYYISKWINISKEAENAYNMYGYEGIYIHYLNKVEESTGEMEDADDLGAMTQRISAYIHGGATSKTSGMTNRIEAYINGNKSQTNLSQGSGPSVKEIQNGTMQYSDEMQKMINKIDAYINQKSK